MNLMDKLRAAITEEYGDAQKYNEWADEADRAGLTETANALRQIAADETRHRYKLKELSVLSPETEEIQLSGRMIEVKLERPFPQTYGDWVNLAENIKERYPDDPVMRASVNYQLQHIAEETELAEEAKRWLMQKAGELGIK